MTNPKPVGSKPMGKIERIAILPLRNSVLFPMSVVPINVGRPRSVRLIEDLAEKERALVGVLAQRNPHTVEPDFDDLHDVGTLARIVKVIRLGPGNYSVVLNGLCRCRVHERESLEPYMQAQVERIRERRSVEPGLLELAGELRERAREMLGLLPDMPRETTGILNNVQDPGALADLVASNFSEEQAKMADRQAILEAFDARARVERVMQIIDRQIDLLRARDFIAQEIRTQMSGEQREDVLREQMRSILEELGTAGEESEIEELRARIMRAKPPDEVKEVARKQLNRLRSMQSHSAEHSGVRNYLDWIADLPWSRTSPEQIDVKQVARCLDEDHHGLDSVKRRIVEYAAIRQLRKDKRGPILLFIGPPGAGKTSLGRSIARALGRRYQRIALGGVRDEAEIRGHRRTYVGALPGRIIQAMKKAGARNPVLVLDEVDKLGTDLRGDPAAALLEVLDPEQNYAFVDHFLDLPFDLSQAIFLATANERNSIPPALLDRMEVIDIPGYTRVDKVKIAEQFLVPKQLRDHGLTEEQLCFTREGLETILDHYTREAGVRNLERAIASVCRATAVDLVRQEYVTERVADAEHVTKVLGVRTCQVEILERGYVPGVATGLSSTSTGGDLLIVEATRMPGTGEISVTGNLRTVMKESAITAVSYVRSRAERFQLDPEWLKLTDVHLHIPRAHAAADAAGAGATMFLALVSLLLAIPTRPEVAVAGELTLRGRILRIEELESKLLAAHRAGIRRVVLPQQNASDLEEIPGNVLSDMEIRTVSHVDDVLAYALADPSPLREAAQ